MLEEQVLAKKKPFLGICVGMQLLAETGQENGNHQGLGWLAGNIIPFKDTSLKIPHMGWNDITTPNPHPLFKDIPDATDFYFVHSYHLDDDTHSIATCNYGVTFPCVIAKDNIMGTQFHPEKSQGAGLQLLENFLKTM